MYVSEGFAKCLNGARHDLIYGSYYCIRLKRLRKIVQCDNVYLACDLKQVACFSQICLEQRFSNCASRHPGGRQKTGRN